jgi:hypothetical protein
MLQLYQNGCGRILIPKLWTGILNIALSKIEIFTFFLSTHNVSL